MKTQPLLLEINGRILNLSTLTSLTYDPHSGIPGSTQTYATLAMHLGSCDLQLFYGDEATAIYRTLKNRAFSVPIGSINVADLEAA
jgi:hypothetical protein